MSARQEATARPGAQQLRPEEGMPPRSTSARLQALRRLAESRSSSISVELEHTRVCTPEH